MHVMNFQRSIHLIKRVGRLTIAYIFLMQGAALLLAKQFRVFPIARKSFSHFSKMYEAALQDIKYDPRGLFLKLL